MGIWAAVIPAVASLIGSYIQSQSAGKTSDQMSDAFKKLLSSQEGVNKYNIQAKMAQQEQAMRYQQQMLDEAQRQARIQQEQAVSGLSPYAAAGQNALLNYMGMLQAGPGQFRPEDQPGYQYGWEQTYRPMQGAASKTGGLRSGGFQTALGNRAQDYANTKYQDWLNRYYQALSPWQQAAGQGQTAAAAMGQIYMGNPTPEMYGTAGTNALTQLAGYTPTMEVPSAAGMAEFAQALGTGAQGNILGGAIGDLGKSIGGMFGK